MSLFDLAELRSPPSPQRFRSAANREEVVLERHEIPARASAESYQDELHNLLEKSRGTPYEATLRRFVESKAQQSDNLFDASELSSDLMSSSNANHREVSSSSHNTPVFKSKVWGDVDQQQYIQQMQNPSPASVSPTRAQARADVDTIVKEREQRRQGQENAILDRENVHKTRGNFVKKEEWLTRLSTPKKTQTRAYEISYRLNNRVMRNTTNHIGRQRPGKDADGIAFSAFGAVNINSKTGGVGATDNDAIFASATNDSHANAFFSGSHSALKTRSVQLHEFNAWYEDNCRWRESLEAKKKGLTLEMYGGRGSFSPQVRKDSKANQQMVDASLVREGRQLKLELREARDLKNAQSKEHDRAPSIGNTDIAVASTDVGSDIKPVEYTDNSNAQGSIRNLFAEIEVNDASQTLTDNGLVLPPPPSESPPDFVCVRDSEEKIYNQVVENSSKTGKSIESEFEERYEREDLEYQQSRFGHEIERRGRDMKRRAEYDDDNSLRPRRSSSESPTVFDRMCVRILAHTLKVRKPINPDNLRGSEWNNAEHCTFSPRINEISRLMVNRRNERTRARSASPSTSRHSTSQRRGSFFGTFDPTIVPERANGSGVKTLEDIMSNNGKKQRNVHGDVGVGFRASSSRRTVDNIFDSPLKEGRGKFNSPMKPANNKPIWGIRSVGRNYLLATDTIGQGLEWEKKQEENRKREIARRRSPSPSQRYTSPVHDAIIAEKVAKERRRSIWHNADALKKVGDGEVSMTITEKLNRFYAQQEIDKENQGKFERTRRGSTLSSREISPSRRRHMKTSPVIETFQRVPFQEQCNRRRNSINSVEEEARNKKWNDHIYGKSRNKGKTFEGRTAESVENFVLKRVMADTLLLKGIAPSPCTYVLPLATVEKFSASNYRTNLLMKNDNAAEGQGNVNNGRAGYSFSKNRRQFAQYGHVKIDGLAHKLLESIRTEQEAQEKANEQIAVSEGTGGTTARSPSPQRRASVQRFDKWGNLY